MCGGDVLFFWVMDSFVFSCASTPPLIDALIPHLLYFLVFLLYCSYYCCRLQRHPLYVFSFLVLIYNLYLVVGFRVDE